MKKNNKYIKIFALTLFFMICLSVNANVNALTDDNGNEIKCILQETGLINLAEKDYCLTFNQEKNGKKYAMYSYTEGSRNYEAYYETNFKKIVLDIREYNLGYDYIITIPNRYIWSGSQTNYNLIEDLKILSENNILKPIIVDAKYVKYNGVGLGLENFSGSTSSYLISKNTSFLIKDGIIQKMNNESNLKEILWYSRPKNIKIENIIYSDFDIYDSTGTTIIKPKEDFEERNITYTYEKVKNNELYDIEFSVKGLKKGDKIFLGNYDTDNEKYLQQFNIISNTENPNARFVFNDISKNARIDILIKDEKDNILISESVNIDIDIFENLKNGNINDFFDYVKNFINNKINKPIKNIMNSFQLLFNKLDADIQIGIVIIFLIMIIFGIFRFLMKG